MPNIIISNAQMSGRLAYDLGSEMDSFSPEDTIIIWTGPFNGTIMPDSSGEMVIYKSLLNGAFPFMDYFNNTIF